MFERDLLVSAIACLFGLVVIWSGVTNHSFAFQLWLPRLLERRLGRSAARAILVLLGCGLIGLGLWVSLGN